MAATWRKLVGMALLWFLLAALYSVSQTEASGAASLVLVLGFTTLAVGLALLIGRRRDLLALTLLACAVGGCARSVRPLPPTAVPQCGPTVSRQTIGLRIDGGRAFPPIQRVDWTINTYCQDSSQANPFNRDAYIEVLQSPNGEFAQRPTDGFSGLRLGRVVDHVERRDNVSFTLASAAQAHWCIRGVARFGSGPPVTFGPFTARQVAGQSSFALSFLATRAADGTVTVEPAFAFMPGCVNR